MSELKYLTLPQLESEILPDREDPAPAEVIAAAEPTDLSRVLDRTIVSYDSFNLYATEGDPAGHDQEEAALYEWGVYQRALDIRKVRNQLGRRAKIAAWFAGVALTVGGVIGAVNATTDQINAEIERHPDAMSDELVKGLTGGMAGLVGLAVTSAAANTARNHTARRNARIRIHHELE